MPCIISEWMYSSSVSRASTHVFGTSYATLNLTLKSIFCIFVNYSTISQAIQQYTEAKKFYSFRPAGIYSPSVYFKLIEPHVIQNADTTRQTERYQNNSIRKDFIIQLMNPLDRSLKSIYCAIFSICHLLLLCPQHSYNNRTN